MLVKIRSKSKLLSYIAGVVANPQQSDCKTVWHYLLKMKASKPYYIEILLLGEMLK